MMELLLQVILIGLAAAQITSLLIDERGPFAILRRFRLLIGVRYRECPENRSELLKMENLEDTEPYALGELGELFLCPRCLGVWVGTILFLAVYLNWVTMTFIAGLATIKVLVLVETR